MGKVCKSCGGDKPLSDYHKHTSGKFGCRPRCKACTNSENRQYYRENSTKVIELTQGYKRKNKALIKEKQQKYYLENKIDYVARDAKRRAAKLNATPDWLTDYDWEMINWTYAAAKRASEHFGVPYHVDHIAPLQGENICGLHVPWNLQVIPAKDNLSKGNKWS